MKSMQIKVLKTRKEIAKQAAKKAASILKAAIKKKGHANFIAATGKSQIKFLKFLTKEPIDWSKTTMFHLDEYIGITSNHSASFRKYLKKRILNKVNVGEAYLIHGDYDPKKEVKRLNSIISKRKIDLVLLGIGEDGHLAFDEPPADFKTKSPYIIVNLAKKTINQEYKEGWFVSRKKVPKKAISMSINQIMKSENAICIVYGKNKREAIKNSFKGKIDKNYPASILQKHKKAFIYLDSL